MKIQTLTRIVICLMTLIQTSAVFAAVPGTLDTTFHGTGFHRHSFGIGDGDDGEETLAVVTQPDGKIVTAGYAVDFSLDYLAVARFEQNGRPDSTFGDGTGKVVMRATTGGDSNATSIALQPDGKIIVTGYAYINNSRLSDFFAVRFHPNGSLDNSFDGDGIAIFDVTLNSVSASDFAYSVDVQPDGKIVLGGSTGGAGTFTDVALIRCNPDGSLDTTFGGGTGKVILRQPDYDNIRAIKVQPDGKIAAVGKTGKFAVDDGNSFINDDFVVMRFNPDGSLDTSFDTDGIAVLIWGNLPDTAVDIALQPDGKIIACGNYGRSVNRWIPALARFNPDGSLDTAFGTGGKVTTHIETDTWTQAVKLQNDGKIVVGGSAYDQLFRRDLLLVRYNADGSLDANFGTGGITRTDILGSSVEIIRDLTLDSFGRIVATGGTNGFPFVARFNGDAASLAKLTGRVTNASGQGIFGAVVTLSGTALTAPVTARTNNFGYYTFTDAPIGNNYAVSVASKRHTFASPTRTFDLGGDLTGIDFVSEQ